MLTTLLYLPLGFVLASLGEYLSHRFVLHGLGKRKASLFHYHFRHHAEVARYGFQRPGLQWAAELLGLATLLGLSALLYTPLAPTLALSVMGWQLVWFSAHQYAHYNEAFCRRVLPHHHRHHVANPHRDFSALWAAPDRWFGTEGASRD